MKARGDYIGGRFHTPIGHSFASENPATGERVLETAGSPERVALACRAASEAQPAWARLSMSERLAVLARFRDAIEQRTEPLAEAISLEMGKIRSEARVELASLKGRFALVEANVKADLKDGPVGGNLEERIRYRPHGVVAVLGPFNFPLHLCHVHVVPALLLGNTVVMKPSEVTPLCGERYAEAADAAGIPPGVLNVVQGGAPVGAALVADPHVRALAFTGSWPVGRRIAEAALDRPEMLLALEMGGKNSCIVREDADLRQAVHEIVMSGYLTTGQRCTCADRVFVHQSRADELTDALAKVARTLRFGNPSNPASFAGPMASRGAKKRFLESVAVARAHAVFEPRHRDDAAFVEASLHRLPDGVHELPGYTDVELFGPDLCISSFTDDEEAIAAVNASPYGFAHSVFTDDRVAFAKYERDLETGILNRNRSTNQASGRLPFGGIKRSGNFRPAGAWTQRNLVYPLAEIEKERGVFDAHAHVTPHLPSADLGRLEARHAAEELDEARRDLLKTPRIRAVALPPGGELPRSAAMLTRFYAGTRYVQEKKPPLFDHLRSSGPWFVSIDDQPLSVLDAMSQTATIPGGFAPDRVVRAFVEGEFADAALGATDITLGDDPHAMAYAAALRALVPGLPTVCFGSSGAEANEKAYALCRANAPAQATKLLAFDGSFHGRTLLALFASHSPSKRIPFQIAGYEIDFAPFPVWARPGDEPTDPPGWRDACGAGDVAAIERFATSDDPLLRAEAQSLLHVARAIAGGTYFAVDVEPMQSEGGDRYATARFYRGLRLLTRALNVALIMDEVQCGFGLGGTFLWHQRFGLVDRAGNPDRPDCVVFAKRAQVGVCLSRFADPEPTNAFAGSLVRGRLHAEMCADGEHAKRIEALVRPRLAELEKRWSHRIENPRATGYAVAFEVKDAETLNAYLGQRFWRGAVVFGAGTRTVRYRLNSSFDERAIDVLFESMQRSLAWLEAHPGKQPPAWEDLPQTAKPSAEAFAVRVAAASEADALVPKIAELEARVYEPARRDPHDKLRVAFDARGVAVIAEVDGKVIGSALAAPLELYADVAGPDRDPQRGKNDTLYSLAVTVDPAFQGRGIGRALKLAQLGRARELGYRHVTGRNRMPEAGSMSRLNDALGASTVAVLPNQYEGDGVARYYRQPVGRFVPPTRVASDESVDLASGIARPFATPPESLARAYDDGSLFGPSVNKLTILNYITPAVVRATEWVAALTPHPHAYLCSGRDETVDKSVRVLRWHRKEAQLVIGLEGGYVGHTTACARSISDPALHRQGPAHFAWPRVPHPARVGTEASIAAIRAIVDAGASAILGIYIEPVGERSGLVIPGDFYAALTALRASTGVPVVLVDTAGAYYRSGRGAFASSGIDFSADVSIWWTGGQLGFVHTSSAFHVAAPLTLVSTWDGDELSLVQMHHQLRAARHIDVQAASDAWDVALAPFGEAARGLGVHRVIDAGDRSDRIVGALRAEGIRARSWPGGHVAISPPLDRAETIAQRCAPVLARVAAS